MTILDNVQMTSTTTGTGTLQLTATQAGYQSFDAAGAANNTIYSYGIVDAGNTWEVGQGTYISNTSGKFLIRSTINYSSAGSNLPINLSGFATIYSNMLQQDYDTFAPANSVTIASNTALNLGSFVSAANGYTFLPNGLLLQWLVFPNANTTTQTVTYPIPFPNGVYSVAGCVGVNSASIYQINFGNTTACNVSSGGASHSNVSIMAIGH